MAWTLKEIDQWPVGAAAAGVVSDTGILGTHGPTETPFALASVTKALMAYAVLIAVEEGTLALDEPAGPPGSTVAHLLAHASGAGPDRAEAISAVGTKRIYSNAGFDMLGELLMTKAQMPTSTYLTEALFAPLGMSATELRGSPAHAGVSTVNDLLRFGTELLAPSLIAPETLAQATTPFLADLSGVLPGFGRQDPNPWGLGFELRGTKEPHWTGNLSGPETFGHFGRSGGFLWVDPTRQLSAAVLTDTDFGPWAAELWPRFNDRLIQRFDGA